jgi:hypothetical protein
MLINRQGKVRLMKWYDTFLLTDRAKYVREVRNSLTVDRSDGYW